MEWNFIIYTAIFGFSGKILPRETNTIDALFLDVFGEGDGCILTQ